MLVEAMPERLRLAVHLGAWCALRYGEMAEIRRSDIDVKNAVVHVRRGVTWVGGKAVVGLPKSTAGVRDVAIPPYLLPVVKEHLERHTAWGRDGLLFPSTRGVHLSSTTFYASWWPAREQAGRPDLRFHDLRHSGATMAARTGATVRELMARLGHSTPGAALIYQRRPPGIRRSLKRCRDWLSRPELLRSRANTVRWLLHEALERREPADKPKAAS